jgi:KaiC/GvpD/RAD55 family RecA-like ATPase
MNTYEMIEWLKNFYSEEKLNILTEEKLKYLYSKTQPKRVKITDMEGVPVASYRVNSADGFVMPYEWRTKGIKKCVTLVTVTGKRLTMSSDHLIEMNTGLWKYAVFIIAGEKVITKDGVEEVSEITYAGENVVYDFHIAHENHRYYTNDISSHNSGSGKSLVMMNIALNWLQMGLSGVYITLELSEELTSLRTDAMLTNMSTKDIRRDMDTAELKVKMLAKKSGQYRVKGLPAQSNVNDIRAYLKEVQIQTGIKIDFVMIDYLDLVMPVSVKVNPNDQFIKDKYVSEELRNLAKELGILMVTASQLNRSAVEEIEFDHSHIAGGISKINTADYVFGIFTSRSMRERGKYQIQCMKSRSSTGVGHKIDLEYNIETMRITDEDPESEERPQQSANQIMGQIRNTSHVGSFQESLKTEEQTAKVIGDVQGSKLKAMLKSLKKT